MVQNIGEKWEAQIKLMTGRQAPAMNDADQDPRIPVKQPPPPVNEEELAEMRHQYQYATWEDHMLVDGKIRARCGRCRVRPCPEHWGCVRWCDECLTAAVGAVGR